MCPIDSENYSASRRSPSPERIKDLLRYYIECIRQDEGHPISLAPGDMGKEFIPWPYSSDLSCLDGVALKTHLKPGESMFANKLRSMSSTGSLLYGYPAHIDVASTKIMPLFTWPIDYEIKGLEMRLRVTPEWPQMNPSYLSELAPTAEEHRQILKSLGLLDIGDDPPNRLINEVLQRMDEMGFIKGSGEQLDTRNLSCISPSGRFEASGVYNCAVLLMANRPTYTAGLIRDLTEMVENNSPGWKGTAFGTMMGEREVSGEEEQPTIEVIPLNEEQRQAVRKAMSSPLTAVTGPPGTGKSQIVVSMIADAYLRGKTILFTSRNNKAVDVVESRVSALAPNPLIVRIGNKAGERNLRQELTNRLDSMLAFRPSEVDRRAWQDLTKRYKTLQSREEDLRGELQSIRLDNSEVESLHEVQQRFVSEYSSYEWEQLLAAKAPEDPGRLMAIKRWTDKHVNREAGLLRRFSLRVSASKDRKHILRIAEGLVQECPVLGPCPGDDQSFQSWHTWVLRALSKAEALDAITNYANGLTALRELRLRDEVAREMRRIREEVTEVGAKLVSLYARLAPDRLTPEIRKAIGNFRALQERLAGDLLGGKEYAKLRREMAGLFRDISRHIPVWCVTNLSARSSLELEPNMFDLLIIDEASQCDIASALPLLYRAKRAVIIGDPNQLRHITKIERHRDQQLQAKYHMGVNDQVFAFSHNSLFDLAITRSAPIQLQDHYRSHSAISSFSNRHWYQDSLRVWTDYRRLKSPPDGRYGIRWTNITGPATRPRSGSAFISSEANEVVRQLVRLLVEQKFDGTVGVVTPFRPQANMILERAVQSIPSDVFNRAHLIVDTAHGFQGDERDIVLFSPCVSSDIHEGSRNFLSSTSNLFNVTVTRARSLLHVVGNKEACANSAIPHIENFASYCTELERTGDIPYETTLALDERIGPWEKPLYEALIAKGLNPIAQHPVNQYRLDLAIVQDGMHINIEVDGESTHLDPRIDAERDSRLENLGWRVVRFWNHQVRDDIDYCVQTILGLLDHPSSR